MKIYKKQKKNYYLTYIDIKDNENKMLLKEINIIKSEKLLMEKKV